MQGGAALGPRCVSAREARRENALRSSRSRLIYYFKIDECGNVFYFEPATEEQGVGGGRRGFISSVGEASWVLGSRDQYSGCESYTRVNKEHQRPRRSWHVWGKVVSSSPGCMMCKLLEPLQREETSKSKCAKYRGGGEGRTPL